MHLSGHSKKKYRTGKCLETSENQNWYSLLAERWTHHEGELNDIEPKETEIAIMLSGNLRVTRQGEGKVQECHAIPGTIWLCPAGVQEKNIRLYGTINECLHLYLPTQPFLSSALMDFDINPDTLEIKYMGGFQDELIKSIGITIAQEIKTTSDTSSLLIDSLRNTLAAHLIHNYSNLSISNQIVNHEYRLEHAKLIKIEEYVLDNLTRKITLAELAETACLSPYHFSRVFKNSTNMTPHQFVLDKKITLAKNMITQKKSISEVSYFCGFSSQSHFSCTFKKMVGIPPKEYYLMSLKK